MLKLLKYEFRKTMFPKLILLAAFVIMEGIFLYPFLQLPSARHPEPGDPA